VEAEPTAARWIRSPPDFSSVPVRLRYPALALSFLAKDVDARLVRLGLLPPEEAEAEAEASIVAGDGLPSVVCEAWGKAPVRERRLHTAGLANPPKECEKFHETKNNDQKSLPVYKSPCCVD